MSPDRRDFLGTLIAAGTVGGSAGRDDGREPPAPADSPPSGPADLASHLRALSQGKGPTAKWDMSWTERIRGRYRAVFDSPGIQDGGEIWRAAIWTSQIAEVYGAKDDDVNGVLVIRHRGIPLVMDDAFWERHRLGKKEKVKDPWTGKTAERNPIRTFEGQTKVPPDMMGASLEGFMKRGGIVLACNFAFGFMVHLEAEADKEHAKEARDRALAHLIPGIILQPSGFFALLEAQRAGCHVFTAGEPTGR